MDPGLYIMFGGAASGDDDAIRESDGETGGGCGVGCLGQVICIYPYVPLVNALSAKTYISRPDPILPFPHS